MFVIIPLNKKISYLLYITQNNVGTVINGLCIFVLVRSDTRENSNDPRENSNGDDFNYAEFGHGIGFQKPVRVHLMKIRFI